MSVSDKSFGRLLEILGNLVNDEDGIVRDFCQCSDLETCSVCVAKKLYRQATGKVFRVVLLDGHPEGPGLVFKKQGECKIYAVNLWTHEQLFPINNYIDEKIWRALMQVDPLKICYGATPEEAAQKAQKHCEEYGWTIEA